MTTMLGDRDLEEKIVQLQKLDLNPAVRQVVEEAEQVLANGHQLEAGALVEKAEAMWTAAVEQTPPERPREAPASLAADEGRTADEGVIERLVGNLADSIARNLATAVRDLEQHLIGETRKLSVSFGQQLQKLQASVESLLPLKERIEDLAGGVSAQHSASLAAQQQHAQLAATTALLQDAHIRHDGEIETLRRDGRELGESVSQRMDDVWKQLGLQQEGIASLQSAASEIPSRMAALVERLDRHADAIRSLQEMHQRRETALEGLVEAVTKLKLPGALAAVAQASL
jgi:hypothetical protein